MIALPPLFPSEAACATANWPMWNGGLNQMTEQTKGCSPRNWSEKCGGVLWICSSFIGSRLLIFIPL